MDEYLISLMEKLEDLENEMNGLEENSELFRELDYEFNYILGKIHGARHVLSQINEGKVNA